MKKFTFYFSMVMSLCLMTMGSMVAQTSATYAAGDISTNLGSYDATCNGPVTTLVVTIPAGDLVTSVDVVYDFTAASGAWMSEQRSQIYCQETALDEGGDNFGTGGNSGGTESYSRTGLALANGVSATGTLTFEMRAWRSWGGAGCEAVYNYINDGTWTVTVNHSAPPACLPTSAGTASNITDTSADLGWTAGGTETLWNVEWGAAGFVQGTGTVVSGVTNPYTLAGLSAQTAYEFYVQADCGTGGTATFEGPYAFTTACGTFALPYVEDMENGGATPNCWTQSATDDFDWSFGTSTPSTGTGPQAGDHTSGSGYFAYIETSSGTAGNTATLEGPEIDASSLTVPALSFWYDMLGAQIGTLDVEASADGATWANVFSISGDQGGGWVNAIADLSAYAGGSVYLRFTATHAGTFAGDISIDDITVIEAPSCLAPTSLTATNITNEAADLGWTAGGTETAWNVEWDVAGFTQGAGTLVSGATNPQNISGLTGNTAYEFYVQADCGVDGTSDWAGPFAFSTLPDPLACGVSFSDLPGPTTDYAASSNDEWVLCPDVPGDVVTVTFTEFSFENSGNGCWDQLTLHNGNSAAAPTIPSPGTGTSGNGSGGWCWDRDDAAPTGSGDLLNAAVVSTAADGCLTLVLTSDGSVHREGFQATYTCGPSPIPTTISSGTATSTTLFIDGDGWHHYTDGTDLMLSLMPGNTDAQVMATEVNTGGADGAIVDLSAAPYVVNTDWQTLARFWNVTPTAQPTADVGVRTYFSAADHTALAAAVPDAATMADMHFYKVNGAYDVDPANGHATVPAAVAATYDADGYWEMANGAAGTATWALGTVGTDNYAEYLVAGFSGGGGGGGTGTDGALPVEFVSFTGKADGKVNVLDWSTASELDNSHFEIERSINGEDFANIGRVEGAGNSVIELDYNFVDQSPVAIAYYRLKQVDFSGEYAYSNVVTITRSKSSFSLGTVRPNPTKSTSIIQFSSVNDGQYRMLVTDVTGKVVLEQTIEAAAGINQAEVNLSEVADGVYFMTLSNDTDKVTTRIVKSN